MAINSNIEWTNHTANLWWGCTKVHAGCDNCYAEALANRFGANVWGNDVPRRAIMSVWQDLDKMQYKAHHAGQKQRVLVGSMMDIFERPMPLVDKNGEPLVWCMGVVLNAIKRETSYLRNQLFSKISAGFYPNLLFLFLTKRPGNINKYIPESWLATPPDNVMFGTSPVDQPTFDTLVRQLQQVKGKRFLSVEPQLAHVTLGNLTGIDWIIQGGESGPGKRHFDVAWARAMRDECATLNIPYFFKQIDKKQPIPEDLHIRQLPAYCLL